MRMKLGDHGMQRKDSPPIKLEMQMIKSAFVLNLSDAKAPVNDPVNVPMDLKALVVIYFS